MNITTIFNDFKHALPDVEYWSLRIVLEVVESLHVRQGVVQPPQRSESRGAHISLLDRQGYAYAATSELNRQGFRRAIEQALAWAEVTAQHPLLQPGAIARPTQSGVYHQPPAEPWGRVSSDDKIQLLQTLNRDLKIDDRIVDWQAALTHRETRTWLITSDGVHIEQTFYHIMPGYRAVANHGSDTQQRSGGGWGTARQGGLEQLAGFDFSQAAPRVAEEALALLDAPECPAGSLSLLLLPSQMMLQIHESIGHPLELDRILGDERNYAGTSFVSKDMCGHYRYGSELLNVTYDPTLPSEMASYAFDDEGTPAQKTFLIRNGILERLLGGATSQARAQLPGVANARACDWNRPPIDRMANLNLEPGDSALPDLIGSIEHGVLMDTNLSWSIDDSRNKFQFGCELGKIIEDGEVKGIVKNPNYRGISATFWRNLAGVGDRSTFEILGTPNCGKGEPQQLIQVGHASPACVFHEVEVFGGE
jgi:predicted Zn-dependent protease